MKEKIQTQLTWLSPDKAIGQMIAHWDNVAISLRTEIQSIIGYSEIIEEDYADCYSEDLPNDLKKIRQSAMSLLELARTIELRIFQKKQLEKFRKDLRQLSQAGKDWEEALKTFLQTIAHVCEHDVIYLLSEIKKQFHCYFSYSSRKLFKDRKCLFPAEINNIIHEAMERYEIGILQFTKTSQKEASRTSFYVILPLFNKGKNHYFLLLESLSKKYKVEELEIIFNILEIFKKFYQLR